MLMIESYDDIRVEKKLDGYRLVINIGGDDCFYKTPDSKDGALMDILKGVNKKPAVESIVKSMEEYEDRKSYKWRYDECLQRSKEKDEVIHKLHSIIDTYEIAFEALKYDKDGSDERLGKSARSMIDYVEEQLKKRKD